MYTETDLSSLMEKCSKRLIEIGIPVSDSICPEIRLINAHSIYGRCCYKGNKRNDTPYDNLIQISRHILGCSDSFIENVMIHELLHTCPEGHGHKGAWKEYAATVNEKLGTDIRRCAGGLQPGDRTIINKTMEIRYIIRCENDCLLWERTKASSFVKGFKHYRCPRCGGHLVLKKWNAKREIWEQDS